MKAILGDFVRRIGGMLLAPRATIDTAIDERGRGSFATMVVLCLLTATALSFPSLMRSTLFAVDVSASAGLMMLVNVLLGQLLLPLCAALLAGLLLSLTGRRKQHPSGQQIDYVGLGALCTLPAATTLLLVGVGHRLFGAGLPRWLTLAIASGWLGALTLLATSRLRAKLSPADEDEDRDRSR
ncbi:MAG: hypothetical protein H6707_03075 [Deltaproteobacteria bacterium]|nr:hypothetical protein [Deltaproteobacteria bacterium]